MIKLAENTISQSEIISLSNWLLSNPHLTKGPLVKEFEKLFSVFVGTEYCVMVNSGSSANLLIAYSLLESDFLNNKKVVVPAVSWITTLTPFIQFGYEVFLCDCNQSNLGLDLNHLEEIFIKEQPSLLILVHVLAHLNDMDEILFLCNKYNVLLIEDSCEALGTSFKNKKAGSFSIAASFSFYYGHHISTIEGGAITTDNKKLYDLMVSMRSHGWARDVDNNTHNEWKKDFSVDSVRDLYTFYFPGFNLRPSDLNAFIGISQMNKIQDIVNKREINHFVYVKLLSSKFWIQESKFDTLSSFAFGTLVKNRLQVYQYLKDNGIESRPLICGSMGLQPMWIKKYGKLNLANADVVHEYGIYLPNHASLNESDIKYICEKFNEIAEPYFF